MKTPSKILIADHQTETTAAISAILQQAGYIVFEAHNEKDCLNLIFSQHPEVLIIDGSLPHGNIDEFCKQVKLNHDLPQLHILLMSGLDGDDPINEFNKSDYFNDYIRKPIHTKELLLKIDMYELMKNMKAALKWQKACFDGVLAGLSDLVIYTDLEGNIINMNGAAENISGWKFKEVENKQSTVVFKIFDELSRLPEEDPIGKVLQQNPPIKQSSAGILITKEGLELNVVYSIVPLKDEFNNLSGALALIHPVKSLNEDENKVAYEKPPSFDLKDYTPYLSRMGMTRKDLI